MNREVALKLVLWAICLYHVVLGGGALPVLYITWIGIRHTVRRVTLEEPEDILFTEVSAPEGLAGVSDEEAASARVT